MAGIADSSAVQTNIIFGQHQAAITLLNNKLQNPKIEELKWLDIACGKGQIISQLDSNLSVNQRKKLEYHGYDLIHEYTRVAEKIAEGLELKKFDFKHGDISSFADIVKVDNKYDFITCTNTAHELTPGVFAKLLISMLRRLKDNGELFIYDMESLDKFELGALPWNVNEIKKLINTMFTAMGSAFVAEPNGWEHKSCKGWSLTIQREYIGKTGKEIDDASEEISTKLEDEITSILEARQKECNQTLLSFCKYGANSQDDKKERERALFEFWALNRIKEMR